MQELYDFAEEDREWLRIFQLPDYAPELNPREWVWSLMRRAMVDFVATDLSQSRPHHEAQAQEDSVPTRRHQRLPRRSRTDHRPSADHTTRPHKFNLSMSSANGSNIRET
ncbi:transposase [Streptomyces sp. NPDC048291]|uniref:transposase n=1 Tax=Streptomyces sp. NPDC048291 TaxID=3365530 RepID=UPI00371042DB